MLATRGFVRHFGLAIVAQVLSLPETDSTVPKLHLKMYEDFIEAIDGIDNGVTQYISSEPARYKSRTDLSARVGGLNPRWNEPSNDEVLDVSTHHSTTSAGCNSRLTKSYLSMPCSPSSRSHLL
jgi:uncharacterized UPF0160 family protein